MARVGRQMTPILTPIRARFASRHHPRSHRIPERSTNGRLHASESGTMPPATLEKDGFLHGRRGSDLGSRSGASMALGQGHAPTRGRSPFAPALRTAF